MSDERLITVVAELDATGLKGRVWLNGEELKYISHVEIVSHVGEPTKVMVGVIALNGTRVKVNAPVTVVNTAEAPMIEQIAIRALSRMRNLLSVAEHKQDTARLIIADFMKEVRDVYTLVEVTGHLGRPAEVQRAAEAASDHVRGEDSPVEGDDPSSV